MLVACLAAAGTDGQKHGHADQPQAEQRIRQPYDPDRSRHRREHHQYHHRHRKPRAGWPRISEQPALGSVFAIGHHLTSQEPVPLVTRRTRLPAESETS
ncbi:hypothetical protein G6F46_015423 [Rhizopus delemar]|nr:hypothetical protein G6F46_015423 [Rhizopus delemar]